MAIEGTPVFNALTLFEIEHIDFTSEAPRITAHAAFVNTKKDHPGYGKTYGKTTCRQWSKATLDKLAELKALMEHDFASLNFVEGAVDRSPSAKTQRDVSGIGELVGGTEDGGSI